MPDNNSDPPSWAPGASDPPSWINLLRDFSQSTARSDLLQQRRVQTFPSLLNSLAPMISTSILHTTQLSISRGSVDQALADFETDISPWKGPVEWVAADSEHVNFVVKEIVKLTDRVEINQARFADQLIVYPVSCDYTTPLTHNLMQQPAASHSLYIFPSYVLYARQEVARPILISLYPLI